MSYYCKGKKCERRDKCFRAQGWDDYCQRTGKTDEEEGFSTGVWFEKEEECIADNFSRGFFD